MNEKNMSRLAVLRDEIGITQKALAARAGLSLPYIKKLEQGKKPMSKRPAVALAIATGVDWRWLAGSGKTLPIAARLGMTQQGIASLRVSDARTRKPKTLSREMRDILATSKPWTKEMADAIQNRRQSIKTEEQEKWDERLCQSQFAAITLRCRLIIQAAMKVKRAELAVARIDNFLVELANEPWLKIKAAKPPRR
jgi:transcriptional regulator with XRE-family HTH domain